MKRRTGLIGVSVLAVTLGACTTLEGEQVMEDLDAPTSWSAISAEYTSEDDVVTSNWLADLQDPVAVSFVAEALAHNQTLAASTAQAKAVRERVGQTRAGLLPSISASLVGSTTEYQDISSDSYSTGLSASWELDVWGRLTDQTRAAYLTADASRMDLAAAELSIAGATAQSYYSLIAARLQRQLSERDVATGEANLRIIERRYGRGISSSLDVRLARSSLASSQATLITRQRLEGEAARRLEVLLGRYPAASVATADTLPTPSKIDIGLGSPDRLLNTRPDVIAAEARMKSAGLNVMAARKALIPSLSLSGSAFSPDVSSSGDISFDWEDTARSLTASLVQPIFQGGRLRAAALAAKQDMEASIASYVQTSLEAYQEVENAIAADGLYAQQLEAQKVAYDEAVAAEVLTNRQYVNGTTDIFNLISAQQRRINAESTYISAQLSQLTNRIDLYIALGAPFEAAPQQLATLVVPAQEGDR